MTALGRRLPIPLPASATVRRQRLTCVHLGRAAYGPTMAVQDALVRRVQDDPDNAHLILVEHDPPVITLGRRGLEDDILVTPTRLSAAGVEVHRVPRGGQATCHSSGQLVAYPILHLRGIGLTLPEYVARLDGVIIRLLEGFNIVARLDEAQAGVWVGDAKIASIGVAVNRWVAYHGLAINVANDLRCFDWIVPCGRAGGHVTSMAELLDMAPNMKDIGGRLAGIFAEAFGFVEVRHEPCST